MKSTTLNVYADFSDEAIIASGCKEGIEDYFETSIEEAREVFNDEDIIKYKVTITIEEVDR